MLKFVRVLKVFAYDTEYNSAFDKVVIAQDRCNAYHTFYVKKNMNNFQGMPKDEYVAILLKQGINEKIPEFISYRKLEKE